MRNQQTIPEWRTVTHVAALLCFTLLTGGCDAKANPFWSRHVIDSGYIAQTVVAADFTGDGAPDIIVNGDRGQTMLYIAPRWDKIIIALPLSKNFHPKHATHSEIMDVDGDGDPDYIGAFFEPGLIFWLERPENPRRSPWPYHLIDDQVNGVHGLAVGDIDGDGRLELAANSAQSNGSFPFSLLWYKIPPQPHNVSHWQGYVFADRNAPGRSHYISLGDVNGDGRMDAACAGSSGDWFAWWEAPTDPTQPWTKHNIALGQKGASNIMMGDVDGDGRLDFIASRGHGEGVVWYQAPAWKAYDIHPSLKAPHSLAVGDLDGDGDLDVVSCGKDAFVLAWYENDGRGRFTVHHIYESQACYEIRLVDIDLDGDLDVLIAGDKSKNVAWYENHLAKPKAWRNILTSSDGPRMMPAALHTLRAAGTSVGTRPGSVP